MDVSNSLARGEIAYVTPIGRYVFPLCLFSFVMALVFGGDQVPGRMPDAIVQLASLPLLVVAAGMVLSNPPHGRLLLAIVGCSVLFLLPFVQLIPLPPSIWSNLPGRDFVVESYRLSGIDLPAQPLSLFPAGTLVSLSSLIPPFAIFLACLLIDERQVRILLFVLIAFGFFSLFLGVAQLSSSSQLLRIYDGMGVREATGLFTNRNNLSALFYSIIPLLLAFTAIEARRASELVYVVVAIGLLCFVLMFFGVLLARSRAGFALVWFVIAGAGVAFVGARPSSDARQPRWPLVVGVILIATVLLVIILEAAFYRIANRFNIDVATDMRWPMALTTIEALKEFFPFGSGFGSFVPIYNMFQDNSTLIPAYINHAHNDWVELILEGGVLALILLAVSIAYVGWCAVTAFGGSGDHERKMLASAGLLSAMALMLHSALEYPLRIESLMVVFALMIALVVRASLAARSGHGSAFVSSNEM